MTKEVCERDVLFFTVCLLYVIVRMNIYVIFLLGQRRLNKLIIMGMTREVREKGITREVCERDMGMTRDVREIWA